MVIRVRDTGSGIPSELLPHVFDLFTQAERVADRAQGGLGIGLSLVRTLTEMHGGTVTASSGGPGQGSEFVVRLPTLVQAPPVAVGSRPSAAPSPAHAARGLVVDDNVDAAQTMAQLLSCGHEVQVVFDGAAAIEAAQLYRPAAVLLDIGLPGMDGYEVARRLRQLPELRGVLLVAVTGYGQERDRLRVEEAGFHHHVVKPVAPELLRQLLAGDPRVSGARDSAPG